VTGQHDATDLLLLIAFRHSIIEPNVEAGFERISAIAGEKLESNAFHDALAACLRDGLIREPVRLPEGRLQCHWQLELTPQGVEAVRAMMRAHAMTADQLLEHLTGRPGLADS
jgi:negative regulator of sigma E activity